MNLCRNKRLPSDARGAALLAALCFTLVLAIALGSYITACYRSLQMSSRNVSAGHSVELAETGMEEALWALHNNDWTGWSPPSGGTVTKTLSGFTYDNNITGNATLTIANYNGVGGTRTITATGTTTSASDGTTQTRTLTATSSQASLFVNAIAGVGNSTTSYNGRVRFKTGGTVDSYNSSVNVDVLPTIGGQPAGFSAVVSSASDLTSSQTSTGTVQMTNAKIKGYIATMPGSAGVNYSTSATLYGPTSPVSPKIDTSRESTSPYQPIFDVITPSATIPLPTTSQNLGTAGATTPTYYYYSGDYTLNTQTLTVVGPVVIVISGYLDNPGSGSIVVSNSGSNNGSIEIFLGGSMWLDGGGIVNNTKLPKNVAVIAQSGNSGVLEFSAAQNFYGVIYAPEAFLAFYTNATFYGSVIGQAVTVYTGYTPTFHYDISLRNVFFAGIDTPFAVASMLETNSP